MNTRKMNIKIRDISFIISLIMILIIGIKCTPKNEKTAANKDPMEDDIEYSFIHMNEYLPIKTVDKAEEPFIFPGIENI